MREIDLHKAVADFLAVALPKSAVFFHYPAGELRDKRVGRKLKRMGTKAGMPDFGIIHDGAIMFIELKTNRGRLSAVQHARIKQLKTAGARVAVCLSVDQVSQILVSWGVVTRAALTA